MSKQGEVKLSKFWAANDVILRPTPFALREVLTELGGARNVYVALYNMEYATVFSLIKAGVKKSEDEKWGSSDAKGLEQAIYDYGLSDLVEPCTRYLTLLINGGREPKAEDGDNSGEA